jgi:hypothetical protein
MHHLRISRGTAVRSAASVSVALVLFLAAAAVHHPVEVRLLVDEGKPREVAECMVLLRQSVGECELGMFTGTYPAAWDTVQELVPVRDAVLRVRDKGGLWSFADVVDGHAWRVCAALPNRPRRCASDVRAASALAFGEAEPLR